MSKKSSLNRSVTFVSFFLFLLMLTSASVCAEAVKLGQVGCDAPKLEGLEWVKGEAVEMQKGSVYVIEFWATWCPPCIKGIPHLTELQHEYKDKGVTVIGISTETNGKVPPFVKEKGDEMGYTVAIDAKGKMSEGYMKAFGQGGIPHAFIVDKTGKIAWRGHPMTMDEPLEQIVAGTFDIAEFAEKMAKEKIEQEIAQKQREEKRKAFEEIISNISTQVDGDPNNIELLMKRAQTYLGDSFVTELSYSPYHLSMAVEDYKKIVELDTEGKTDAAENVSFFVAWQDRTDQRNAFLKSFVEKYPKSIRMPFAMYALYYVANKDGNIEEALGYITKADEAKIDSRFGNYITETKAKLEEKLKEQKSEPEESKAGTIGSVAPKLAGLEWVKGDAVEMKKDSVYVIEFWATWCPPCRTSIPHLTELQHKYKDENVTLIGVSTESTDKVKPFVDEQGDKMDYTVAVDAKKEMSNAYMKAFGQGGIPHAFIVDKQGNVAWHGHPMMMDEVLEGVVNGTFDAVEYAKQQAVEQEKIAKIRKNFTDYFTKVADKATAGDAKEIGVEVVKDSDSQMLNAFAWRILTGVNEDSRDIKLALRAARKANKLEKGNNPAILDTFALAMFESGKTQKAIELQTKAVEISKGNERMQSGLKQTLKKYSDALN